MPVVLHFRTLGDGEAKTREYVDNLFSYERNGVTSAYLLRCRRASEVDIDIIHSIGVKRFSDGVNLVGGKSFQLVKLLTDFALLFVRHIAKIVEERCYFAFFAKIFYS